MASPKQQLVLSIGGAAFLLALSGAIAYLAFDKYEEQVTLEDTLARSEQDARNALQRASESLALSARVSARFSELQAAGLFDPIDKPRAIDGADAALHPYLALVARYQIGGGSETAPVPLAPAARYQIQIQRVAVDFEPLHEERFLDVWEAISGLRGPAGGVENCELHRPARDAVESGATSGQPPTMKARCLLTWYRLQSAPAIPAVPAPGDAQTGADTKKES